MAESPITAAPPAAKPRPKGGKTGTAHFDVATLAGIALALAGILGGLLLERGSIQDVVQTTAAMIVFGGTFGAVLVTTPMPVFRRALQGLKAVFFAPDEAIASRIESLIEFATKARRYGIVSLETEAAGLPDPYLRKAMGLAVDGTDLAELRKIMEIDIALAEQAGEAEARVWEAAGGYAPTVGIIGAVMGLIQVMKHLEDIKAVGHGIAVAFVATVYGVGSANIFFLPAANKLRARHHATTLLNEATLEGVVGIVEGLNPTLLRTKLSSFGSPEAAPAKARPAKAPSRAPRAPAAAAPARAGAPQP
jgi:chemotaxis protein MotA